MQGSFSELLGQELSPEAEAKLRELLKRKMKGACSALVRVLRALEERYGPAVKDVAHDALMKRTPRPTSELGRPEEDLHGFCDALERGCVGSHRWKRAVDQPDRIAYNFTSCLWAEIFNELDAADIGWWWCEGDEPAVRAYNPQLGFERTKTLMQGHDECDHVFLVEE